MYYFFDVFHSIQLLLLVTNSHRQRAASTSSSCLALPRTKTGPNSEFAKMSILRRQNVRNVNINAVIRMAHNEEIRRDIQRFLKTCQTRRDIQRNLQNNSNIIIDIIIIIHHIYYHLISVFPLFLLHVLAFIEQYDMSTVRICKLLDQGRPRSRGIFAIACNRSLVIIIGCSFILHATVQQYILLYCIAM